MNWATWAGLMVSIFGFGVSIQQILKVKAASLASERATRAAFARIRERASLADVTTALLHLETLHEAIRSADRPRAIGTIRLLRCKLVGLRHARADQKRRDTISLHLTTLSDLLEQLMDAAYQADARQQAAIARSLERMGDMLQDDASEMRYKDDLDRREEV